LPHRYAFDIAAAAVVAAVEGPVGTGGQAIGPAARRREQRHLAVGRDARTPVVANLGQDHRSVGHRNRTLGETKAVRQNLHVAHLSALTAASSVRDFITGSACLARLDRRSYSVRRS